MTTQKPSRSGTGRATRTTQPREKTSHDKTSEDKTSHDKTTDGKAPDDKTGADTETTGPTRTEAPLSPEALQRLRARLARKYH